MPELQPEADVREQVIALSELQSFALQTRLSAEMAYLSLFIVGMARYAAEKRDEAIPCFSDALSQAAERVPALDQSIAHFYRGLAYEKTGEKEKAIADFQKALELSSDPYWRQRAEEQLKALGAK